MTRILPFVVAALLVPCSGQQQPAATGKPAPVAPSAQSEPAAQSRPTVEAAGSTAKPLDSEMAKLVIPAGTKIPLALKQGISTKSAKVGDPVYCETTFPYVQDEKIVIPAGTYIQGEISAVKRPGRVKGRAELLLHFTSMIYPSGYTVMLPGTVENVPGAENSDITGEEGTIRAEGTKGRDTGTVAKTAGAGAGVGGIAAGRAGVGWGGLAGAGAGLAAVLFTRGEDVRLPPGTSVEMVFQRAVTVDPKRLTASRRY